MVLILHISCWLRQLDYKVIDRWFLLCDETKSHVWCQKLYRVGKGKLIIQYLIARGKNVINRNSTAYKQQTMSLITPKVLLLQ
jgi:hypothetical protein